MAEKEVELGVRAQAELVEVAEHSKLLTRCPNDCSGHGTCSANRCTCSNGYTGADCSFTLGGLTPGVSVSGSLTSRTWSFYHLPVPGFSGISIQMNSSAASRGDCDLYIAPGYVPSLSHYYARDVSLKTSVSLIVRNASNAARADWYAGVYAFSGRCDFVVLASLLSVCRHNCNGNGVCAPDGTCSCNSNYVGTYCDWPLDPLTTTAPTASTVLPHYSWHYYSFSVPTAQSLITVSMAESSAFQSHDCDLYLGVGTIPTITNYAAANLSVNSASSITYNSGSSSNVFYVGVFGFLGCTYTLNLAVSGGNCLGNSYCSNHGQCTPAHDACMCNEGFSGSNCQNMTLPLDTNQPIPGYVRTGSWNYYYFYGASTPSVLHLNETFVQGDCDMYVGANYVPTFYHFDYLDVSLSMTSTLTIRGSPGTVWNVAVYGFGACDYQLTLEGEDGCDCNGHGTCDSDGNCDCTDLYAGDNCELSVNPIALNTPINGTLVLGTWNYYAVMGVSTSAVTVDVLEYSGSPTLNLAWLFVRMDEAPDLLAYDAFGDVNYFTGLHHVTLTYPAGVNGSDFYVGIYPSPDVVLPTTPVVYTVKVSATDF